MIYGEVLLLLTVSSSVQRAKPESQLTLTSRRITTKPRQGTGFGWLSHRRTMPKPNATGQKFTDRFTSTARRRLHFRTPYKTDHYIGQLPRQRSPMPERINLDDKTEVWEWTCPRGHRNWEPTNFHFWWAACARSHDLGAGNTQYP